MTTYSIRDEYAPRFGRQNLTIWSGGFASDMEGWAQELPGHDGFMVTLEFSRGNVRVECPAPRNEENFEEVDDAIAKAIREFLAERDQPSDETVSDTSDTADEVPSVSKVAQIQTLADAAYDRDDRQWFYNAPLDYLCVLWGIACANPFGASWDDEVFDALAERGWFEKEVTK